MTPTRQQFVLRTVEDQVATLTLNEPEARNPLSPELVDQLTDHLREAAADPGVCVVIVTGAGKGFSAGADLRRMRAASPLEDRDEYDRILDLNRLLWGYPKPTISAVHGFALGAGANLATWCDLTIIDAAAKIGYPEVKAGVPSATVIPTLMRLVGRKRMYELILTGMTLTADEALDAGLVTRVAAAGTVYETACELAATLAGVNPSALRYTKEIVQQATDMSYGQAIVYAKDLRVISRLRPDFRVEIAAGGDRPDETVGANGREGAAR
jgi:methylglutaconyl-CoA hydratase